MEQGLGNYHHEALESCRVIVKGDLSGAGGEGMFLTWSKSHFLTSFLAICPQIAMVLIALPPVRQVFLHLYLFKLTR